MQRASQRNPARPSPARRARGPRSPLWFAGLSAVLAAACASPGAVSTRPVPAEASEVFAAARMRLRLVDADTWAARAEAAALAREASRLAPDWVAPRRFLDEEERLDLLGPDLLDGRRRELLANPEDATLAYLVGRLEDEGGRDRFRRAAQLDPSLSWAQHGLAWRAFLRGSSSRAIGRGEAALALARDPFERSYFASMLARYRRAADDETGAVDALESRLLAEDASDEDRLWLGVELASIELSSSVRERRRRGARRALTLLGDPGLTVEEVRRLVFTWRAYPQPDGYSTDDVRLALAERGDVAGVLGEAPWLLGSDSNPLGLALLAETVDDRWVDRAGAAWRDAAFAVGDPAGAVEAWRAALPARLRDASGLPRDARLARVVRAARSWDAASRDPVAAEELGAALIAAGWFDEAQSFAQRIPGRDVEAARELELRARAGRNLLAHIAGLVRSLDRGEATLESDLTAPPNPGGDGTPIRSIDDLLRAMAPAFARAHAVLGGETDEAEVERELVESPRVGYGIAGELIHPGATFSEQDEQLGRGEAGDAVPGLAAELLALGRFGLFGEVSLAGPPDATILPLLRIEERSGVHLGVPWSGTVVWCQGVDLPGRSARRGAPIAGAALHEGYWIDVRALRAELSRWSRVGERFAGEGGRERVRRALDVHGLALGSDGGRADIELPLGAADRVRLAVLADRAPSDDEPLGEMTLDELVGSTEVHEEGHLCDRTRWYPVGEHWGELLFFIARSGFSPTRVSERLEYRAQLVALCDTDDPRLALVEVLEALEGDGNGHTPHTSAYRTLARDLLRRLDRELEADPEAWPELDPERRLLHQLHVLGPERVRELARRQAEAAGLVAEN